MSIIMQQHNPEFMDDWHADEHPPEYDPTAIDPTRGLPGALSVNPECAVDPNITAWLEPRIDVLQAAIKNRRSLHLRIFN